MFVKSKGVRRNRKGVGENPLNGNSAPLTGHAEGEDMVYSIRKRIGVLLIKIGEIMKKFDKEYSTQYTPEKDYLLSVGIHPSFVKVIDGTTTYKYTKTSELFKYLMFFYCEKR